MKKSLPILLAGILQLMPMLRAVLPMQAAQAFVPTTWAIIFKIGAGAVAMFGYHAISSATVFIPPSGTTFNLTTTVATNLIVGYSGSHTPGSWSASPNPVCAGMTLAKGASTTTISGTPTAAGSFTATITAWSGSSTSGDSGIATYYFNVASPPVITNITVVPSASVSPGTAVTFTPVVGGTTPLTYRWKFNGVSIFGGTNATLSVGSAQSTNAGTYTLIVANTIGSATNSTVLAVNGAPAITGPPQDQYVAAGGTANFTVTAGGAATLAYQWYKDGVVLTGKTTAALSLAGVQATNAGRYWITVSNSLGTATSSVAFLRLSPSSTTNTMTVFPMTQNWRYNTNGLELGAGWRQFDYNDTAWPSGPGILGKEDTGNLAIYSLITNAGTMFASISNGVYYVTNYYFRTHFTITNTAQVASLIISNYIDDGAIWYLNGTEAFRYNMPAGPVTANTFASANLTEGIFTVSNLPPALLVPGDNVLAVEVHQVSATSSDEVMGATVIGTFTIPNTVPLILTNPVSQTVNAGTNVIFTAAADGTATVTYQWYKGATLVSGATGTTLTLTNVQPGDAVGYTFVANNAYGSATSQVASLTVNVPTPPTITTQPLSQITPAGSNITFTVGASGTGLSYLWRFNSNALVTATASSLTLTNVAPPSSGYYSVIVSNAGGSVTSTNAQLLVVAPPAPGSGPHFAPPAPSGGQFSLSFPTSPGYRYLLQTNASLSTTNWGTLSNVPPAFNGATITLPQPTGTRPSLFYRVTVTAN